MHEKMERVRAELNTMRRRALPPGFNPYKIHHSPEVLMDELKTARDELNKALEAAREDPATVRAIREGITPDDELDERHAHEIMDERLQWDHGTLSTHTMNRVMADILADVWQDCYRRGVPESEQYKTFCQRVLNGLYIATGRTFRLE